MAECVRCCWGILFACENRHVGRFGAEELARRFDPEVTLEQIAERLVCSKCGGRDGSLTIEQDHAATSARDIARFNGSAPPDYLKPSG